MGRLMSPRRFGFDRRQWGGAALERVKFDTRENERCFYDYGRLIDCNNVADVVVELHLEVC